MLTRILGTILRGWNEPQVYVDAAEGVRIPKCPAASREVSKAVRKIYPAHPEWTS